MRVIAFLLLVGPGVLVWKLSEDNEVKTIPDIIRVLLDLILDCTIILIVSYITLFILYGWAPASFSSTYLPNVGRSIYSVSFVWKYGVMSGVYAIVLAVIKRIFKHHKKKMAGKK